MFPRIAVTSGEPAGIGPELCLRLAEQGFGARLVIIADRELLQPRAQALGLKLRFAEFDARADEGGGAPGRLEVLHVPLAAASQAGKLDSANARYVLALIDRAIDGCGNGEFAAMVTSPVHKAAINAAGAAFTGHTEYLATRTGNVSV